MSLRRTVLIHAPFSGGAGVPGCEMAPAVLRRSGLVDRLRRGGAVVGEVGCDVPACGVAGKASYSEVANACASVHRSVQSALLNDEVPVVLGGDHSLSIGSVASVAEHCQREGRPFQVLWFDAHADFNTPVTSPSGNAHGMPVAVLCGLMGAEQLTSRFRFSPLDPASIHLIGVRAMDVGEEERVRATSVSLISTSEVMAWGGQRVLQRILDQTGESGAHLHVSLDVDVLDPDEAPGVGTPEPNGLPKETLQAFFLGIAASGCLGSLDVMEFNPLHDRNGRTARVVTELVTDLLAGGQVSEAGVPVPRELGGGI